ncbi:MAG: radical SAM protein [Myxococcota bacterium]|nr:radical SAM protein [Myxococcota bacterium]
MSALNRVDGQGALLRREPFGGILFIPQDAVHIELDRDAFCLFQALLDGHRELKGADEEVLIKRILTQIEDTKLVISREVDYLTDVEDRPFTVYNAPTLADFQITTRCPAGCAHCYASSTPEGTHVGLADAERVFDELSKNGVTQVAIGGGEPLCHPDLAQLLKMCRARGMVPSLTTNGIYFDEDTLATLEQYCGAVALSLEGVGETFDRYRKTGFSLFKQRLAQLLESGIATVLQVTLSEANFGDLAAIVNFIRGYPGLYGVIFLAYKEVGRGRGFDRVLARLPSELVHEGLRDAFLTLSDSMRVGYDCCLTPAIVGLEEDLEFTQDDQLEGCSAMRSSIGILPTLDVVPCTFTTDIVMGNLKEQPLFNIWRSDKAKHFRNRIEQRIQTDCRCVECTKKRECLGGCPVFDLVECQPRHQ